MDWRIGLLLLLAQQAEFRVDVNVVNLPATVTDASGRVVSNLTADDFELEENGVPQQIRYFSRQGELPLTVALLADTSFSQRRLLESQRAAARIFFGNVLRPEKDRAMVMGFDYELLTPQGLTGSREKLSAALDRLETPASQVEYGRSRKGKRRPTAGTKIYDAVTSACEGPLRSVEGRKAILLITDGLDLGSAKTLEEAVRAAQQASVTVYAIRYFDAASYGKLEGKGNASGPQPPGAAALQKLAADTGGHMFEAAGEASLRGIFSSIEEELRNQYSIGYTPTTTGGGFRTVHLRTKDRQLTVRTRAGYTP